MPTILISFLILLSFLKQRPKNDNFNAEITLKKVLSEKEIFMDALVIVYVVASTRSIDPIFSGLVEDQEGDEEDATYFIITGTVISFFVTSVLVVTLNYLERRFIMIFGLVCTTTGLLIVGPINYSLGGSSTCLRTSIYFLDFGMTVGTAAGLPTLYNTIKYRLR